MEMEKVDAIVVLGRHNPEILEKRIRKAEELYKRFRCKVILSGGKRGDFNEGEFMRKHVKITKKDIIIEDKSLNTKLNALYCNKIIIKKGFEKIIIVTSPYHILRAFLVFRKVLPLHIRIKMFPSNEKILFFSRFRLFFIEVARLFQDLYNIEFNPKYKKLNKL